MNSDFTQIRGLSTGQRQSFEELVCQLARREPVQVGSVFRRIEGSGGDGGVEAYWLLPDGTKIGCQAKFFTKAGEIDWRQVDKSVEQAIRTHPTLIKYYIAFACDLTGHRGAKGKGQSGWELWDTHKATWRRNWLSPIGCDVEFIPWTASDLRDKLSAPAAEGLRRYWFGDAEFSSSWFGDQVHLATASLDERYHPDDHVDVAIESLFQFITRHEVALQKLRERLTAVKRAPLPDHRLRECKQGLPVSAIEKAEATLAALLSILPEFDIPCWQEWNLARWRSLSIETSSAVGEISRWAWDAESKLSGKENEKDKHEINFIRRDLDKLSSAIESFDNLVTSRYLRAEQDRVALIEGRAGTGKSHLLGRIADLAVQERRPVVLILGQQLRNQPLWEQITKRLGLGDIAPEAFLQALDAAAVTARKRGLIIVDAVNEGAGARLWKPEIVAFLELIKRYSNLACIVTCRSEYVRYILPDGLLEKIQQFELRGFETAEEQMQAAKVYLDKRGISRPSTPWLAPEFINPLFLRSTCVALSREKKSEFPRGLVGTKAIFAFYIQSVGRNLGVDRDGTSELVPATIKSLREIAARMAADRTDYVSLVSATEIASDNFAAFPLPDGQSWRDVLHRNGLLRMDPDPSVPTDDPLAIADDIVRFSFQRFQDHLMAEALLEAVTDIGAALKVDGPLAFVLNKKRLTWEWQGLVEALSIQVPERFNVELVDVLPGGADQWWRVWQIPEAFVESVRWRDKAAFSNRTLELFNHISGTELDQFSVLIELSASVDHPWNAEFLHRNLLRRKLPDRDRLWTETLNNASVEGNDPVGRLIDWCLFGQTRSVDRATQRLSGIALCWLFTSSNRYIRDRATKALTSVLLSRCDLFPEITELFEGVDDIYVLERLFAAAFGACCIDPSHERLESYALATFKAVFAEGSPPLSLLLRDYARGIVELCFIEASLPTDVVIDCCRPPYRSSELRLTGSEADVERIADRAGDKEILHSCNSFMGDFSRYEIEPRVRRFTAVRLSRPQPISRRERFARFEAEVIEIDPARVDAVKRLRDATSLDADIIRILAVDGAKEVDEAEEHRWAEGVLSAEKGLLRLFSSAERRRYHKEAASQLGARAKSVQEDFPVIDMSKAKRWIAKRAYGLGWTKKLFPSDSSHFRGHSRQRPTIERIGKKYQWIALDEFLCQLADNYWLGGGYVGQTKKYDNPLDVGFERDIDPTIIPLTDARDNSQGVRPGWVIGADIVLDAIGELELSSWPFLSDPGTNISNHVRRRDEGGNSWVTLYEDRSTTERYEDGRNVEHGLRLQEVRIVTCIFIPIADRQKLVEYLREMNSLNVSDWNPIEFVDGPFLRETPWRDTWALDSQRREVWGAPNETAISFPVCRYLWESHLDAALPMGARALIPSPWLAKVLSLAVDKDDASIYRDVTGEAAFIGSKLGEDGSSALIDEHLLDRFLVAGNLQCVWLFIGERNAWPGGHNGNAAWRRSEGICWREGGKLVSVNWKKDNANGISTAMLPSADRDKASKDATQ
jgi:hypothetical protein